MSDYALASIIRTDAEQVVKNVKDWSWLKGKRVLVTGGTGLIGTHILAVLERLYHANIVRCVSYTAQERPTSGPLAYMEDYLKFYRADLTHNVQLERLPCNQDIIIHAAGYGQPSKFMADGLKTIKLNTTVTNNLHEHLASDGRFLFLSTSEIYSGSPDSPYTEHHSGITNPAHPRAPYIEGKRCGEAICFHHHMKGRHYRIARVALAYGPGTRVDDGRAINQFIQQALTQGEVKLRDFGGAHRTYCYITDCVEALFNILGTGKEPVYNVGGCSRTTIRSLAKKIADKTGAKWSTPDMSLGDSVLLKVLSGAPEDVWLDTKLADLEFDKVCYTPLDDGLDRTIEYQRILYGQ